MGTHRKPAIPGSGQNDQFDFDALLHPAGAFASPADVACDTDLTLNEKRAILAAWASDAREGEAAPEPRSTPGAGRTVALDDVMDALRALGRPERNLPPSEPLPERA